MGVETGRDQQEIGLEIFERRQHAALQSPRGNDRRRNWAERRVHNRIMSARLVLGARAGIERHLIVEQNSTDGSFQKISCVPLP